MTKRRARQCGDLTALYKPQMLFSVKRRKGLIMYGEIGEKASVAIPRYYPDTKL
jgi:hypothetical protein